MNGILVWGADAVRTIQHAASPALTALMKGLSFLGTEWFVMAALPFVYWCVDRRRGIRMGLVLFLSAFSNYWLKNLFAQPRPYDLDPSLAMAREPSFGLPSGHAQASAVFWGSAAPLFRRPWGLVAAVVLPFLIGFSRIYLGVHFPTDVLAGWALGAAFVVLERPVGDWVERHLAGQRDQLKLALVAATAFCMNVLDIKDTMASGAFFGLGAGLVYAARVAPHRADGAPIQRSLRYLVGTLGTAILYVGPRLLTSGIEAASPTLVRFIRYAVLGVWMSLGAPWLFLRLGLAERELADEAQGHSA